MNDLPVEESRQHDAEMVTLLASIAIMAGLNTFGVFNFAVDSMTAGKVAASSMIFIHLFAGYAG